MMRTRLTSALSLVVLCAGMLLAQRMRPMNNGGAPPDPAAMVARRVNSLKTLLNLTDSQAAQATTIFTTAETSASALRTNLMDAQTALRNAVKANDSAAIDQQAAAIGMLTGQMTAIQSKADAAFYALLTPDQQAKFGELHGEGFGGPGRFGMGPGGPPRRR
jgi:Spy/CpxP family protein refolding chaperone